MAEDYAEYRRSDVTPELIKSMVTVEDVLQMLDIEVNSMGKFTSPYNPTERTPSAQAYDEHFWDYSTGQGGDIFDLIQVIQPELRLGDIMWKLWTGGLRSGREPGDVEKAEPRLLHDFTDEMPPHRAPVVAGVGCQEFDIRMTENGGEVWIPHAEPEGIYGVKVRYLNGQKTSLPGSQFTHRLYHPKGWTGLLNGASCVITEGESDAWAIWPHATAAGLDVFALPSGASAWKDHWMDDLKGYDEVRLAFDNDRAGEQATDKATRKIGWDRVKRLKVPGLYGDVREAIQAGWQPNLGDI